MNYGDRGEAVRKLQLALLEKGFELPRWGADGALGNETWAALQQAADRFGIDPLPEPAPGVAVYPDLIAAVLAPPQTDDAETGDRFALIDLRTQRIASAPRIRMTPQGKPHQRAPTAVTGICLHQTAVRFGVSARQLASAGGDRAVALARRALDIAAHATVFHPDPAGTHGPLLVPCAPLAWHVNHANGMNPTTLGIEVDGLYAGVEDDPRTVWGDKPPTAWTDEMARAVFAMVEWLLAEARGAGMDIRFIYAHRQSSATRRADPGELIWRTVALRAVTELGLRMEPKRVWGSGLPLPAAWGIDGGGRY